MGPRTRLIIGVEGLRGANSGSMHDKADYVNQYEESG
jgi:hypothetical protein